MLLLQALVLSGCGSMQNATGTVVRDDVYYLPSTAPAPAVVNSSVPDKPEDLSQFTDDYYDPNAAEQVSDQGFYDVAYNDPYYYNYGRFGFGTTLGYQTGWGGPGWGMGMGTSWNSGYGWNDPWMSMSYGWGSPYYGSPYSPYGMYAPYGYYGYGYNPYGGGPYYGPWGSCQCCYSPVIYGGGNQVISRHRTGLTGGGSGSMTGRTPAGQTRMVARDPAGLRPAINPAPSTRYNDRSTTGSGGREVRPGQEQLREPATRPVARPNVSTPSGQGGRPAVQQREAPTRNSGSDRGTAAPTRSGGDSGGSRSSGGSSGGSRSGGGTRPR
jgi:hypothetical protein